MYINMQIAYNRYDSKKLFFLIWADGILSKRTPIRTDPAGRLNMPCTKQVASQIAFGFVWNYGSPKSLTFSFKGLNLLLDHHVRNISVFIGRTTPSIGRHFRGALFPSWAQWFFDTLPGEPELCRFAIIGHGDSWESIHQEIGHRPDTWPVAEGLAWMKAKVVIHAGASWS